MTAVSFHFHGYQPGDLVRCVEPDPLKPPRFEERRSPVSLAIGSERVAGRNWTDAVLRTYGRMEAVLDRAGAAASVDIEPYTLVGLLERDREAYQNILDGWANGTAGLALTPPFHPILPHHHRLDQEALFDLMIDFYAPILRRVHDRPIGLWLPEAAYSADVLASYIESARRAAVDHGDLPDDLQGVHLVVDARQVSPVGGGWGRTTPPAGVRFVARDPALSGDFAFGASAASDFCARVMKRNEDSVLIASDLESLLANPAQAERLEAIVASLRKAGAAVSPPTPPADGKAAALMDYSSWSDYDEFVTGGHTSDTRWTGLRRFDGTVVGRMHRGRRVSQLWKHAFTIATERVETAVRRTGRAILRDLDVKRRPETLRRLAVAYGRHLFEAHYRASGMSSRDLDFASAAEEILRGKVDVELAGHLARGYTMMLMGLRSDPRFWDNPDTRVTFQNTAMLAQSLVDMARACELADMGSRGMGLLRLLQATLLEFGEAYARGTFVELEGAEGWETTEVAWHESLQSEVPRRSDHDVFLRATLFAVGDVVREKLPQVPVPSENALADAGHIVGEAHGDWENKEWCEHRVG